MAFSKARFLVSVRHLRGVPVVNHVFVPAVLRDGDDRAMLVQCLAVSIVDLFRLSYPTGDVDDWRRSHDER